MNRYKHLPTYRYYPKEGHPLTLEKSVGKYLKDYKIYGNSVQDGTPTPDTPIEVESVGERTSNLCGGNNVLLNKLIGNSGNGNISDSSNYHTLYMEVNEGETYTFTNFVRADGSSLKGCFYDENNAWVSAFEGLTVTIPTGVKYIGRSFSQSANNVQLIEGNEEKEYEPYGYKIPIKVSDDLGNETITNIYLNEPLRKIGKYADYIDFEKRKVVRKVGNKLLDGSYNTSVANWRPVEGYYAVGYALSIIPNIYKANSSGYIMCNRLVNKEYSNLYNNTNPVEGISTAASPTYSVFVRIKSDTVDTKTKFLNYLNENPLDINYVLEKEEPETIELPNIPTHKRTTIIEVDTTIEPTLQVQYYK